MFVKIISFIFLLCFSADALEVDSFFKNGEGLDSSLEQFKKNYTKYDWVSKKSSSKELKLFSKPVDSIEFTGVDGKVQALHVLLNRVSDGSSASVVQKEYREWGEFLNGKLGSKVKKMSKITVGGVERERVAWNLDNGVCVYEKRSSSGKPKELWLSVYEKSAGYSYLKKSGFVGGGGGGSEPGVIVEDNELDLKGIEKEQKKIIKEILGRRREDGIGRDAQAATNLNNVYRFLCGVPYGVKPSVELNDLAELAAKACKNHGGLSHDLGENTDKSNLTFSSAGVTMLGSVTRYIDDAGDNNRKVRGHRRWCLNPPMTKVGFGVAKDYSAMYIWDGAGVKLEKNFGYPGEGVFPLDYLKGNSWSYYTTFREVDKDCKVEVIRLKKETTELPEWGASVEGHALAVDYVSVHKSWINFEPEEKTVDREGTYLVRIEAGELKEQYFVHLY